VDLLFLSDMSRWKRKPAALASLAENMVRRLTEVTPEGRLYEVDTRLRPEGRNAPLVTDAAAFLRYMGGRASLWERQTMTRFRWIAGDADVAAKIMSDLHSLVYDAPLPGGWVGTILEMRRTMESRIRTRGPAPIDLKLGRGGLVDIEFLVQMSLLRSGRAALPLHASPVMSALPLLGAILDSSAAERLSDNYRHFRTAQALMRLTLEDRGNLLPEGRQLERLARAHTGAHAAEYRAQMLARMEEVRKLVDSAARALAGEERR